MDFLQDIVQETPSKIVLLVLDGLGGLPLEHGGPTELEAARIPNLDSLAQRSLCGLSQAVGVGITPGSAPGHLSLFGYDPVEHQVGRGVMEALGIAFPMAPGDVAARGNFCTVDGNGLVSDRRAGRISSSEAAALCRRLGQVRLTQGQVFVEPVKEHRFVVVFRGRGLHQDVSDSDPQREGVAPLPVKAHSSQAEVMAATANEFVLQARSVLAAERSGNMVLLRGFSEVPHLPSMAERYKLRPAAIASYPMYRGLAKLVGMKVLATGSTLGAEVDTLSKSYGDFDFFFIHYKDTDHYGEDGDFKAKVQALEEADAAIPRILGLNPDVLMVAGDHSTPAALKGHSWHPCPFLLHSKWSRWGGAQRFTEPACAKGVLGTFPAVNALTLALAHAGKLAKFGP